MFFDVIIVGGGPAGLACAEVTSAGGLTTLILERKTLLGKKVCAGGITWNGLIKKVSGDLCEKQFSDQYIFTRHQNACVSEPTPIIATIDRQVLGREMAEKARRQGAEIHLGCQLLAIEGHTVSYLEKNSKAIRQADFRFLVGADGSSSFVRRYLGIPTEKIGVGIHYMMGGNFPQMQWHLDSALFGSGYGWIFPHKDTASIGGYADSRVMSAKTLKNNVIMWAEKLGYSLAEDKAAAEGINFDYRGHSFGNIFLVGDAAGLASGLTGEGIYPAIVSGESVGNSIVNPHHDQTDLIRLIKNHKKHSMMVSLAGKNRYLSTVLTELVTYCLKKRVIDFRLTEMAR